LRRWDVVVVGAGPAGSVAARETARRGSSTLLLDRESLPRWKVCGGCLSPGSLSILEGLGLGEVVRGLGAVPLDVLVLRNRGRSVRLPLGGSVSLSRAAFDFALVRAAVGAGAECRAESRVSLGPLRRDGRVVRVERDGEVSEVLAAVVVDATGLGRGLVDDASARSRPDAGSRVGLGAIFSADRYPVAAGALHMAVGRAGYVGLVRDETEALNVAAAVDPCGLRAGSPAAVVARILEESGLPGIGAEPSRGWRGTPSLTRAASALGSERLFRLGDAAGYVEPFTGEGMCWALAGARAVAALAHAGASTWRGELLAEWETHHRRHMLRSQKLCRTLAAGLRRPRMVAAAVGALELVPALAAPFVRRAARAPTAPRVSRA